MFVVFDNNEKTDLIMSCSHKNRDDQKEMMHRLDIDEQVKEWQKTHSGQPPIMRSRIKIKQFFSDKEAFRLNII